MDLKLSFEELFLGIWNCHWGHAQEHDPWDKDHEGRKFIQHIYTIFDVHIGLFEGQVLQLWGKVDIICYFLNIFRWEFINIFNLNIFKCFELGVEFFLHLILDAESVEFGDKPLILFWIQDVSKRLEFILQEYVCNIGEFLGDSYSHLPTKLPE